MLLHNRLEKYHLILASQSPRRRQLMADSGLTFSAVSYDLDELYPSDLAVEDVAPYLSKLKSEAYPEELSESEILITADTVVILDDKILGKPSCEAEGRAMLRALSGREHLVMTGVTLRSEGLFKSFATTTRVRFGELTEEEIEYYIGRFRPLDKAGSYGIQEWIGYVGVEGIEGSFYNVMGLPIQRLYRELGGFIDTLEQK